MTDPKTLTTLLAILASAVLAYAPPVGYVEFVNLMKILIPSYLAANITGEAAKTYVAAKARMGGRLCRAVSARAHRTRGRAGRR
jgi:hypothetical protein